ncbi:MAG: ankyrin repeat domain-containing protein [Alphaproteobacteria bacterium]
MSDPYREDGGDSVNAPLMIERAEGRVALSDTARQVALMSQPALLLSVVLHICAVTVFVFGLPQLDLDWLEERTRPENFRVDVVFMGPKEDPEVLRAYGSVSWDQSRLGKGSGPKIGPDAGDQVPASPPNDASKINLKTGGSDDGKALAPLPRRAPSAVKAAQDATPKPTPPEAHQDNPTSAPKSERADQESAKPAKFKSSERGEESRGGAPDQTAPGSEKPDAIVQGTKNAKEKEDKALAAKGNLAKITPISGTQQDAPSQADSEKADPAMSADAARSRAEVQAARKGATALPGPGKSTKLAALSANPDAAPDSQGKSQTPTSGALQTDGKAQGGRTEAETVLTSTKSTTAVAAKGANSIENLASGSKAGNAPLGDPATGGGGKSAQAQGLSQAPAERQGNVALRLLVNQMPGVDSDIAAAITTPESVPQLPPTPRRQQVVERIRKAAERGAAHAQYGLARRELLGQGVPRDPAHAVEMLERAARQGHVNAQVTLGFMAARGYGMKQDLADARTWLALAASQGNESAARAAALIEPQLNSSDLMRTRREVSELKAVLGEPAQVGAATKKQALLDAVAKGDLAELRTLIARGEDADGRDIEGKTALINAGWRGEPMMVGALLEAGADPDLIDKHGRSAINWASSNGYQDVVDKLIKSGVEIDYPDIFGRTALIRATINGHVAVVKTLLAGGAKPETKDKAGFSALDHAKKENYADLVQLLSQAKR